MTTRSRRHGLLQHYGLEPRTSVRLSARPEKHEIAHIRVRSDDVQAMQKGTLCKTIVTIGLFSTNNAKHPVLLRSYETIYFQLLNTDEEELEGSRTETQTSALLQTQTEF
jgi:hypothetical protein